MKTVVRMPPSWILNRWISKMSPLWLFVIIDQFNPSLFAGDSLPRGEGKIKLLV